MHSGGESAAPAHAAPHERRTVSTRNAAWLFPTRAARSRVVSPTPVCCRSAGDIGKATSARRMVSSGANAQRSGAMLTDEEIEPVSARRVRHPRTFACPTRCWTTSATRTDGCSPSIRNSPTTARPCWPSRPAFSTWRACRGHPRHGGTAHRPGLRAVELQFLRQAGAGGHQDALASGWRVLADTSARHLVRYGSRWTPATPENGCLRVIPGSHRRRPQLGRHDFNGADGFEPGRWKSAPMNSSEGPPPATSCWTRAKCRCTTST